MTKKQYLLDRLDTALRVHQRCRTRWQRLKYLRWKYVLQLFIKKVLRSKKPFRVRSRLFSNVPVRTLSSNSDLWLFGVNPHDGSLVRFLVDQLASGDIFLDIGAHHGLYTILAGELVGSTGEVHAFEPTQLHFLLLSSNTVDRPNIFANQLAVSDHSGEADFFEHEKESSTFDPSLLGYNQVVAAKRFRHIIVKTTTLDHYCSQRKIKPTIIKIDVEGAEALVIEGGQQILAAYQPIIIMEVWKKPLKNESHLRAIKRLAQLGYQPFALQDDGSLLSKREIDPERDIRGVGLAANFVWLKNNHGGPSTSL